MDGASWVSMAWTLTKDGDPVGLSLFRRHYTYRRSRDQFDMFNADRNRNMSLFVGPGEKLVLLTPSHDALFVWRKFISMDAQSGVTFPSDRRKTSDLKTAEQEPQDRKKTSDLKDCESLRDRQEDAGEIGEADQIAWERWPGEDRHYTYVDPKRVKSRNPGYCFIMAGWKRCGYTKSGLIIFEILKSWGK